MRLHRERRRKGLRCVIVELRETEVDALIRKGMLNADARNNSRAVRKALYAHHKHWGQWCDTKQQRFGKRPIMTLPFCQMATAAMAVAFG